VFDWFFRRGTFNKDFDELMVFITPRIIETGGADLPSAEQLWRHNLKKTEGEEWPT
jgi:type II secretory pathway component GspD/PulD (secretin)